MQRVATRGDDICAYSDGSKRATLRALAMVAGGATLCAIATFVPRESSVLIGILAIAGLAGAFAGVVRLAGSLVQSGIHLDRAKRRVTVWRRAVVPLSSTTRDLATFWTVVMSPGRLQTRFASKSVFVIGLHGEVGEPVTLHADEDYAGTQHLAREIADFLGFPFTDASAVDTVVHPPGVNSPLDHRRSPATASAPPAPPAMQCRAAWDDTTLLIEEPPVGWWEFIGYPFALFVLLALATAGLGTFAYFFGTGSPVFSHPLLSSATVIAALFVGLVALLAGSMPQLSRRREIRADAAGLRCTVRGPFAVRERVIRSAEIRELRISLGHLCVITPRDYRVLCGRVGHPLPRAELEWLRDRLHEALALKSTAIQA